jgi:lactam utilization protein B
MSLASAVQEGKFLSQLLEDMVKIKFTPVTLHCDNQGALALEKKPCSATKIKHIDIRYHFVRSEVQRGLLHLLYVTSKDNT